MADRDEWSAKAEPSSVAPLRRAVVEFAGSHGMSREVADDLRLCVSEAVTNAVLHAFRDRVPGTVSVTAEVDAGDVVVRVSDDGRGFAPRNDSPGLGLGLSLIGDLASELTITRPRGGGTIVSMSFRLAAIAEH